MAARASLRVLLLVFSGAASGAESEGPKDPAPEKSLVDSVGVATMLENGTILVGVPGPGSEDRARAVLMVEPGDTNYQPIIDHVGGLKPGETKPIPPWPDPPPPRPDDQSPEPPPGA